MHPPPPLIHPFSQLLERALRVDAGGSKRPLPAEGSEEADAPARLLMRTLEGVQLLVPRAKTFELVSSRTHLLADFVTHRTLTGDVEIGRAAEAGKTGLLQLFDRGTNDRKELEVLLCTTMRFARPKAHWGRRGLPHTTHALNLPPVCEGVCIAVAPPPSHHPPPREVGRILMFTSSEMLIDRELVLLLGEEDRREGVRRADAYLILERDGITFDAYSAIAGSQTSRAAFFKAAHALGLVCGA